MKGITSTTSNDSLNWGYSGRFSSQRSSSMQSSSAQLRSSESFSSSRHVKERRSAQTDGPVFPQDSRQALCALLQEALDIVADEGDNPIQDSNYPTFQALDQQ